MRIVRIWILSAAALSHGASPVVAQVTVTELVGCYQLTLDAWQPAMLDEELEYHNPPSTFELAADAAVGILAPEGGLHVGPPIVHRYSRGRETAWWEHSVPNGVRVVWTDGFNGAELRLTSEADSLFGDAVSISDDGRGAVPSAHAVAKAIQCVREGHDAGAEMGLAPSKRDES